MIVSRDGACVHKFTVGSDVKTYPRLKDSYSKTYRIIYTHQEALRTRNECRILEE